MMGVEGSAKLHRAILVVGVVGDMGQNQSSALKPGPAALPARNALLEWAK